MFLCDNRNNIKLIKMLEVNNIKPRYKKLFKKHIRNINLKIIEKVKVNKSIFYKI